MKEDTKEKRKYTRIPGSVQLSYRILADIKTNGSITKDISRGGMRLYVKDFLPKDSLLQLVISLKEMHFSFEALARVKWIKKKTNNDNFEIGVEFIEVAEEGLKQLSRYLRLNRQKKHKEDLIVYTATR